GLVSLSRMIDRSLFLSGLEPGGGSGSPFTPQAARTPARIRSDKILRARFMTGSRSISLFYPMPSPMSKGSSREKLEPPFRRAADIGGSGAAEAPARGDRGFEGEDAEHLRGDPARDLLHFGKPQRGKIATLLIGKCHTLARR